MKEVGKYDNTITRLQVFLKAISSYTAEYITEVVELMAGEDREDTEENWVEIQESMAARITLQIDWTPA